MMAEKVARAEKKPGRNELTTAQYAEFIHQMELNRIWLKEASAINRLGPVRPARTRNDLKVESQDWEPLEDGFRALHAFRVEIWDRQRISESETGSSRSPDVEIRVVFAVDYFSKLPMTEGIFSGFKMSNLPLNTWPYFREFVSSMTARMNWADFFVPTYKVNTRPPKPAAESSEVTTAKRRSAGKKVGQP